MAEILSSAIGGKAMMAFWYHFAILFEALFILTTIDAGTRVARFMIQDLIGSFAPAFKDTRSWTANIVATTIAVTGWGYFIRASSIRSAASTRSGRCSASPIRC
jgi:carbon starvation protein